MGPLRTLLCLCCLAATASPAHAGDAERRDLIGRIKQADVGMRIAQQTCTTTCSNTKWTHRCSGTDVCHCSCDQAPVCQCKPYPGTPSGS